MTISHFSSSPGDTVAKYLCLILSKSKMQKLINPSIDTVSRSNFHNDDNFVKSRNYLVIKYILQANS